MKATENTVVIKPEPLPEMTSGGLFFVGNNRNERTGLVVGVGDKCDTVKAGQRVLYFDRRAVKDGGLDYVNETDDVLMIL